MGFLCDANGHEEPPVARPTRVPLLVSVVHRHGAMVFTRPWEYLAGFLCLRVDVFAVYIGHFSRTIDPISDDTFISVLLCRSLVCRSPLRAPSNELSNPAVFFWGIIQPPLLHYL